MDAFTPEKKSFLGSGWAFPVAFVRKSIETHARVTGCPQEGDLNEPEDYSSIYTTGDAVKTASEIELVEQSLTILLGTRPGERVMRPDYGCALDDVMFEPANTSLLTYIKDIISKAILYYEPRVQLRAIHIDTEGVLEGRVLIELDLIVRSTNSRYNYVYDFYQREATIRPI